MKTRKIIMAMPTEEEFMPSISRWGHEFNCAKCEVHFVHVVRKNYEVSEVYVTEYPDAKKFNKIKESSLRFFQKKAKELLPEKALENARFQVFLDPSPADRMVEYAKEIDANMIVVATRNKRGLAGLFTSSFADRMLALAPCDVLVLRPNKV
ncbi:MAG: universal stress protein [Bacteriovoracia bacterium]